MSNFVKVFFRRLEFLPVEFVWNGRIFLSCGRTARNGENTFYHWIHFLGPPGEADEYSYTLEYKGKGYTSTFVGKPIPIDVSIHQILGGYGQYMCFSIGNHAFVNQYVDENRQLEYSLKIRNTILASSVTQVSTILDSNGDSNGDENRQSENSRKIRNTTLASSVTQISSVLDSTVDSNGDENRQSEHSLKIRNTNLASSSSPSSSVTQVSSVTKESTVHSNGDVEIHYEPKSKDKENSSELHMTMKEVLFSISGFNVRKLRMSRENSSISAAIQMANEGSIGNDQFSLISCSL